MQPPGKIATMCSVRLQGKHKPIYHALSDCGDHVVIINSKHIAFSGNKWEQKVYSSHTGYPGGFKQLTAAQLHHKDPKAIVKLAVYGMLPRNLHRRTMMQRLHIFSDDELPDDIRANLTEELPQPREIPRKLSEYTQEEKDAFPKLWTPPEDYKMKWNRGCVTWPVTWSCFFFYIDTERNLCLYYNNIHCKLSEKSEAF